MANNVTVVELGGQPKVIQNVSSVKEAAEQLGIALDLTPTVNGKSATYDTSISDFAFISFGAKVKGGK
jgi:hypothetical protein